MQVFGFRVCSFGKISIIRGREISEYEKLRKINKIIKVPQINHFHFYRKSRCVGKVSQQTIMSTETANKTRVKGIGRIERTVCYIHR